MYRYNSREDGVQKKNPEKEKKPITRSKGPEQALIRIAVSEQGCSKRRSQDASAKRSSGKRCPMQRCQPRITIESEHPFRPSCSSQCR